MQHLITIGLCAYIIHLAVVGLMAHYRNRSVVGWVYCSIWLTPIIGITALLCLPVVEYVPTQSRRRDREV